MLPLDACAPCGSSDVLADIRCAPCRLQVCFQLWLASSLMADSLAVACQTMLAKSMAAKDTSTARGVSSSCSQWCGPVPAATYVGNRPFAWQYFSVVSVLLHVLA
jgi:hypothetical protein